MYGMNSYARGDSYGRDMYDMNNSYARGNSYMYYDPRYEQVPMYSMARGYSRHGGSKQEMIEELQQMMGETSDEKIKAAIQEAITRMNK